MRRWLKSLLPLLLALPCVLLALPAAAAPLGRPIWWKVSDRGGSVLWILGIPDGLIDTVKWDQAALRHRLDLAQAVVMPMLQDQAPPNGACAGQPRAVLTLPGADNNPCGVAWRSTLIPIGGLFRDDPLSRRLSPDLLARVEKNLPHVLGDTSTVLHHARTMDVALWLDVWNWPHDGDARLGNLVTLTTFQLAQRAGLRPTIVPRDRMWRPAYISVYPSVTPPEALQQKCLKQVLDQTESGQLPALRLAAEQAWAQGDLEHALRRTGDVHYCLMGDEKSAGAPDYLKAVAFRYAARLDKAFDQPGQTLALVELDPLLLEDGGVLEHFRRLGFEITTSDGME